MSKSTNYSRWYEKNREILSAKRAERYKNDPEYRAKALERSVNRRKSVEKSLCPEGYAFNFQQLADYLDMSLWTLRDWRRKNFFPEPHRANGRSWFTEAQAEQLKKMRQLMKPKGPPTKERAQQLQDLIDITYSNW